MTDRRVLGWLLSQDLRPEQNLPGGGADAGWVYALPSLDLRSVGHIGGLSERAEGTLGRLATRIVPLSGDGVRQPASAGQGERFDLIVVSHGSRTTNREIAALASRLAPEGVVYVDGPAATRPGCDELDRVEWWVTPLAGEPVTVVPSHHLLAAEHFMHRRLSAPLVARESIGRARRRLAGRWPGRSNRSSSSPEVRTRRPEAGGGRGAGHLMRAVGHRAVYGGAAVLEQVERGLLNRVPRLRRRAHLVAPSGGVSDAPPAYILRAAGANEDLIGWQWSMTARAEYRTQKVVFFLLPPGAHEADLVAKVARSDDVSPRLQNAYRGLVVLDQHRGQLGARMPAPASLGEHRGLAILVEEAVAGASLDRAGVTDRRVERGVELLVDLGVATAGPAESATVAAALEEVRARCEVSGVVDAAESQALGTIIAELAGLREPVSCVLQHGDPGCWNMVVRPSGDLVLLDWENVEPRGMPLWDLLDFLRSCAVVRAGARGRAQVAQASSAPFLGEGDFAGTVADAVRRYRAAVPMDDRHFVALFYSAWAYQALKESTRQRADAIGDGVYARVLRTLLARHRGGGSPLGDDTSLNR